MIEGGSNDRALNSGCTSGGGFRREVQPVDSIGSSTESRVSHSKRRLLLGFEGTKTARREGISSTFSDARGCTSRRNSRGRHVAHGPEQAVLGEGGVVVESD